jgi:hypothetical protein
MDDLSKVLSNIAAQQPRMGEMIPVTYNLLEEAVVKERTVREKAGKSPIASWSEFSEMALKCSITPNKLTRVTQFLHDMGTLIHFPEQQSGLSNLVFLDPKFLVDLMATVVSSKTAFIKKGVLRHKDLALLWRQYPTALHQQLLALLEKFEISIELQHEERFEDGVSLFPWFLEEGLPDVEKVHVRAMILTL